MAIDLAGRHFLKELDFTAEEFAVLVELAAELKAAKKAGHRDAAAARQEHRADLREDLHPHPLRLRGRRRRPGRLHARIWTRPARRSATRSPSKDTARVLGRMFDAIEYRGDSQAAVEELAAYAGVPVYNGLTDDWHPTQMLADVLTMTEHSDKPLERDRLRLPRRRPLQHGQLLPGHRRAAGHGRPDRRAPRPTGRPRTSSRRRASSPRRAAPGSRSPRTSPRACGAPTSSPPTSGSRWASPRRCGTSGSRAAAVRRDMDVLRATGNADVKFLHCLPAFHDLGTDVGREIHERHGPDRRWRSPTRSSSRRTRRLRPGREPAAHHQGAAGRHARPERHDQSDPHAEGGMTEIDKDRPGRGHISCARPRSSASARWSAPGSSRCSARRARSPAPRSGCRSSSRDHRRAPGLLVRQARRPLSVRGGPARVRQPGLRRGPLHRDLAWLVWRTPSSRRWSPCPSAATRARCSPTATRSGSKVFAALIIVVMTALNIAGSRLVAARPERHRLRRRSASSRCSRSSRSPTSTRRCSPRPAIRRCQDIFSSVALTFFAFLGFGIVTFTAKDLRDPRAAAHRRCTSPSGIATVDLRRGLARRLRDADRGRGDRVGRYGARGRRPAVLGHSGLLAHEGDRPVRHGRRDERRACTRRPACPSSWRRTASSRPSWAGGSADGPSACSSPRARRIALAVGFGLSAIASIGSAVALLVFMLITIGHLRIRAGHGRLGLRPGPGV